MPENGVSSRSSLPEVRRALHERATTSVAAAGGHAVVLPPVPGYLEVELDKLQARLVRRPKRAEVPVTCEVQLVVEYYAAR